MQRLVFSFSDTTLSVLITYVYKEVKAIELTNNMNPTFTIHFTLNFKIFKFTNITFFSKPSNRSCHVVLLVTLNIMNVFNSTWWIIILSVDKDLIQVVYHLLQMNDYCLKNHALLCVKIFYG